MEVPLCRLCVPSISGVRAGFDVDASRVFPHGVLATVTLMEGVAAARGARDCAGCEPGLPLCSLSVAAPSGVEFAPTLLGNPEVEFKLILFPLSLCFSSPYTGAFAPDEGRAEVNGACVLTQVCCAAGVGFWGSAHTQPEIESFPLLGCPTFWCCVVVWNGSGDGGVGCKGSSSCTSHQRSRLSLWCCLSKCQPCHCPHIWTPPQNPVLPLPCYTDSFPRTQLPSILCQAVASLEWGLRQ